jgi:hypothetical protein
MSPRKELAIPIDNPPEIVRQLWEQKKLPLIYRPPEGRLLVRLPYQGDNREWMREKGSQQPEYHKDGQYWITPRSWYDRLVRKSLARYGGVYTVRVVQKLSKCAPSCWKALGPDCHCSCNGEGHGKYVQDQRWNIINETLAVRWGPRRLRCTLLLPTGVDLLIGEPAAPPVRPPRLISRYESRFSSVAD